MLEFDGGVLLASRVLRAAVRWLSAHSAVTLWPRRAVTAIGTSAGRLTLADGTSIAGDLVLIATGPWSRELVDLPLVLYRADHGPPAPARSLRHWWQQAPWADQVLRAAVIIDQDRYDVVRVRRCHYLVEAPSGGAGLAQIGAAVWARAGEAPLRPRSSLRFLPSHLSRCFIGHPLAVTL